MAEPRWNLFASPAGLAGALADAVAARLAEALAAHGAATLAVSGGTTPGRFFAALSGRDLDWTKVTVTLVDERFVPPDSPRSNEGLVREKLLTDRACGARFVSLMQPVPPPPHTPPLKGEGGVNASESPSPLRGSEGRAEGPGRVRGGGGPGGTTEPEQARQAAGPKQLGGVGTPLDTPSEAAASAARALSSLPLPFDVVVLGMGNDGHTASFFPDAEALDDLLDPAAPHLVEPVTAPSAGEPRLTLTLPAVAQARFLAVHIEGAGKKQVLEAALTAGAPPFLPIRRVLDAARSEPQIFWAPSEGP